MVPATNTLSSWKPRRGALVCIKHILALQSLETSGRNKPFSRVNSTCRVIPEYIVLQSIQYITGLEEAENLLCTAPTLN